MDPKAYKKLQQVWTKKLKQSGFVDIEQADGQLKNMDSLRFQYSGVLVNFHEKAEYYRRAEHFLNRYVFRTKLERAVWEMHADARGERVIALKLKVTRRKVVQILRVLKAAMKQQSEKELDDYE